MYVYPETYDVIVIGGGHAGVEASLAAARMGSRTLLLTANLDTIGQMSCNPAIGGLAKGHLVREIDAMGGEMGVCADMTGIQFRMLNTKRGPSVRAPRAQCDKKAYQFRMKLVCERQPGLDCRQGLTARLVLSDGSVVGVETALGVRYMGKSVIITTGTFLRGLMHVGDAKQAGGRAGEAAANDLSTSLCVAGLRLSRLKTGTPPRLNRRSIDWERMARQDGDEPVPYFSHWNRKLFHVEHPIPGDSTQVPCKSSYPSGSLLERVGGQVPCYITYTTPRTAELVRANLHKSPVYSGVIEGIGPRYCPSIEDKVVRFADKDRHQIFLEPEGLDTEEIYVNGFSTCLPFEIQVDLVRTIVGCEAADIMRPAYAVEYDFSDPTQLYSSLETKVCRNLYLAGQINGTSGYEEAAAQGLMAGINAARRCANVEPVVLRRDQAYIGVLIDDLVTKGTTEPYRMFTSRAEYRLLLRQDNADERLSRIGYDLGLLSPDKHRAFLEKRTKIEAELARLTSTRVGAVTLAQILKRPEVSYSELPNLDPDLDVELAKQVEIILKYEGYIERQKLEADRFVHLESKQIPEWMDYRVVPSLRTEARHKLERVRPGTIGQASRISGVSPADISLLLVWMKRGQVDAGKESGCMADPGSGR
jgi:tRNA uridine 5-carboxymethylaminomethyl modification enzyme